MYLFILKSVPCHSFFKKQNLKVANKIKHDWNTPICAEAQIAIHA